MKTWPRKSDFLSVAARSATSIAVRRAASLPRRLSTDNPEPIGCVSCLLKDPKNTKKDTESSHVSPWDVSQEAADSSVLCLKKITTTQKRRIPNLRLLVYRYTRTCVSVRGLTVSPTLEPTFADSARLDRASVARWFGSARLETVRVGSSKCSARVWDLTHRNILGKMCRDFESQYFHAFTRSRHDKSRQSNATHFGKKIIWQMQMHALRNPVVGGGILKQASPKHTCFVKMQTPQQMSS